MNFHIFTVIMKFLLQFCIYFLIFLFYLAQKWGGGGGGERQPLPLRGPCEGKKLFQAATISSSSTPSFFSFVLYDLHSFQDNMCTVMLMNIRTGPLYPVMNITAVCQTLNFYRSITTSHFAQDNSTVYACVWEPRLFKRFKCVTDRNG